MRALAAWAPDEARIFEQQQFGWLLRGLTPDEARKGIGDLLAAADAGLCRAEITRLDLADVDLANGGLTVHGKGNKERLAWLEAGQLQAVQDWIAVRGTDPGPLLWPINKAGRMTNARISAQTVYNVLRKRGEEAHVENFTPHDLRRTLATELLETGAPVHHVKEQLGHANAQTTLQNYTGKVDAQARRRSGRVRYG